MYYFTVWSVHKKSALLSSAKSTHSNTEESNLPATITLHNADGWIAIAWQLFQLQIQSTPKAHGTRVNTLYGGDMEEVRERKRCVKVVWKSQGCECLTSTHKVNTDSPATNASFQFARRKKTSLAEIWGTWKSLQKVHRIMRCGVHTLWRLLQPFSYEMQIHQSKRKHCSTLETLHMLQFSRGCLDK